MADMKRILRWTGRCIGWIITAVLIALVAVNLYIIIARNVSDNAHPTVLGYSGAVVVSGSMADTIEVNDIVIAKRRDSYEVGDVVSFESGELLITHRIVDVRDGRFVTKGDANDSEDAELLSEDNIVGEVFFIIPGAGKALEIFSSPGGMALLFIVAVLIFIVPALVGREEDDEEVDEE